ncbi:MAG: type I polyketide synthase, partial [Phycisphaerae bacterium]|nr:type I polyketide synthase [Phycisphaerae bacterium]
DQYPTRVRLPDEPLMLVDRILEIEGEPAILPQAEDARGRVITEHDIHAGAWYLDGGRIPTCIAVEAGQADLFLSGYLGIDLITKGRAVYRLLDAQITFHRSLPGAGETIRYDIHIDHFFRQGQTWLFRFRFDATVNGEPLLSMTDGCAGFFTEQELAAGGGIVQTALQTQPMPGQRPADWRPLVPMAIESFTEEQLNALRRGDLATCFGPAFAGLGLHHPAGLPGGRMTLVHRILRLEPEGGRFGLGEITGEADIHPDDWFLTCHFVDDRVMPGTLMYECCLHTLRVFLLRMGWVGEANQVVYEPVPGVASRLKCRGQVRENTQRVQYRLTLKQIGYEDDGTPFVRADALMSADGRAVVQMEDMSVRLAGLTRAGLEKLWNSREVGASDPGGDIGPPAPSVLYDRESILAFSTGNPSEAFGEPYRVFDQDRVIARLPRPPYQFLDRIVSIEDCQAWQLEAGGEIEAEYDVPSDAWYFETGRHAFAQPMPFAVLLEVALQPCGWLAAYLGSALRSDVDLCFRNLGGKAILHRQVMPDVETLSTSVKITRVSESGGMIIQHYDFRVRDRQGMVYEGNTYFGFFTHAALANQVGIPGAAPYAPVAEEAARATRLDYPTSPPFPDTQMRMIDRIDLLVPDGGPEGLGLVRGLSDVDETRWFFKAHFYQDPVWPGSLGLESFLQLLKVVAADRFPTPAGAAPIGLLATGHEHEWIYRGQILPTDRLVTVQATITATDAPSSTLHADGFLSVDGRIIYQMNHFALALYPRP